VFQCPVQAQPTRSRKDSKAKPEFHLIARLTMSQNQTRRWHNLGSEREKVCGGRGKFKSHHMGYGFTIKPEA